MEYIYALIIGYILGSFQTSYFLGKLFKKTDIRTHGTNNAGASNATIVFGWKYGIFTAIIDISKTILAILIISSLFPYNDLLKYIAGFASILGHIYPFYLNFRGGKGFASYMGLILAINWKIGFIMIVLCFLITIITDYIVIGTLFTITTFPIYNVFIRESISVILILVLLLLIISYKHRINIVKIINHQEKGLRAVLKSSH